MRFLTYRANEPYQHIVARAFNNRLNEYGLKGQPDRMRALLFALRDADPKDWDGMDYNDRLKMTLVSLQDDRDQLEGYLSLLHEQILTPIEEAIDKVQDAIIRLSGKSYSVY